jgi:calcineurin-like phosphoesterase family protein
MTQPPLPPGDLLLHAGDLSIVGSQAEIQEQLNWLSSQPHTHKIVIAGNHDVLFDPAFLEANPVRKFMNPDAKASGLNLGSVIYLQDESVTLKLAKGGVERELKIYGSPKTPQYGSSAFQVPPTQDVWSGKAPEETDILLTHGPPRNHLDGGLRAGCINLAREVMRVRPRVVLFGHVHAGYGIEEVRLDRVRSLY